MIYQLPMELGGKNKVVRELEVNKDSSGLANNACWVEREPTGNGRAEAQLDIFKRKDFFCGDKTTPQGVDE